MDEPTALLILLKAGLHQCRVLASGQGGLLFSLWLAGLTGGISHCAGMCGPFVLSQVAARLETTPATAMREWHRLTGAALIPYHFGRATTYALLGAVAAAVSDRLKQLSALHWLSAALLVTAALFMLAMAVPAWRRHWDQANQQEGWWSRSLGHWAQPLFARPTGWRGYGLGVALGFIPCGLLWGALAAASALGRPALGALAMLAFTLGTLPSLLAIGLLGHLAGSRWRAQLLRYAPLLLMLNAAVLLLLAWQYLV